MGTEIKFYPATGTDTIDIGGVSTSVGTRHQCITVMAQYSNKSLEELRLEDYAADRKGGKSVSTLFGNGNSSSNGQNNLGKTGNSINSSAFSGNPEKLTPLFGTPFRNSNNDPVTTKTFGFGTSTTPSFSFGAAAKNSPSPFSFEAMTSSSGFGTPYKSFSARRRCKDTTSLPTSGVETVTTPTPFGTSPTNSCTSRGFYLSSTGQNREQKTYPDDDLIIVGKISTDFPPDLPTKCIWTVGELPERSGFYRISSPKFSCGSEEWCMCLYLNDLSQDKTDDTAPSLQSITFGAMPVPRNVIPEDIVLVIEPRNNVPDDCNRGKHWKLNVKSIDEILLTSFRCERNVEGEILRRRYIILPFTLAHKFRSSPDKKRAFIIELGLESGEEVKVEAATQIRLTSGMDELSRDLKQLLCSGDSSDANICVKGRDFPVHRSILATRTPVFSSMFRHKMSERETGEVYIGDCEPETFERFLQYVYSGKVDSLTPENAGDLYEVADKYQVEGLKADCLECIKEGLSARTVSDAVSLAVRHNETELMRLASDFFALNIKDVLVTVEWQTFLAKNVTRANELLIRAHQRNSDKK